VNGVHDLGGTDGLGRVVVPDSEPVFRAEWEKAAFAMFSMCFRAGYPPRPVHPRPDRGDRARARHLHLPGQCGQRRR